MLELDHVFVCASRQDTGILTGFGLTCADERIHEGQGTANARFFFDNAYFELVWLNNEQEIQSPVVAPLSLWERVRWRETGACPFGVAFRAPAGHPFATWDYRAPYLPPGTAFPIVTPPGATTEPFVFLSLSPGPPSEWPVGRRPPLEHQGRRRTLKEVRLELPAAQISEQIAKAGETGLVTFRTGRPYHMTLLFDGGERHRDFRPALPLSLDW